MKERFQLYNTQYGETICLIEMDDSLLSEDAGIVDPIKLTLRPLHGGSVYTLIPLEVDHKVAALRNLHSIYEQFSKDPIGTPSGVFTRMDYLYKAVENLFQKIEYRLVESKKDLQDIIDPPDDYTPKKIMHNILGDLLDEVKGNK